MSDTIVSLSGPVKGFFEDGNGRMGRLWHTLLLYHYHPVFEFTPVESLIQQHQQQYYQALHQADQTGDSTGFIEFLLRMIHQALQEFTVALRPEPTTTQSRLERARLEFKNHTFSRRDYMNWHKTISTATASRDLKAGIDQGWLHQHGEHAQTRYQFPGKD
jgi:Fic family protein